MTTRAPVSAVFNSPIMAHIAESLETLILLASTAWDAILSAFTALAAILPAVTELAASFLEVMLPSAGSMSLMVVACIVHLEQVAVSH